MTIAAAVSAPAAFAAEAPPDMGKDFPNINVESISQTPVRGLYEVVAGNNVFYYADGGFLLFGELWDKDGKSLTAETVKGLMQKKLGQLPLDKAVKVGSGPNIVIEFTDPDCPYCRKAHEFLKTRTDITRYVFFNPLDFHPHAKAKSRAIICGGEKALEEVYAGSLDKKTGVEIDKTTSCTTAPQLLEDHIKAAKGMGVRGTPTFWINGQFVSGADTGQMKAILDGKEVKSK